jgi:microcystin-dependent protein
MEYNLGEIILFGGNFNPRGTLFCQGQILAISTNTALFSLLGTMYGGNGQTTFALPNLAGRVPVGSGTSASSGGQYTQGEIGGTENVTLTQNQMPMHTHVGSSTVTIPAVVDDGNSNEPSPAAIFGTAPTATKIYSTSAADSSLKPFPAGLTINPAGGSQPFSVMQPFQVISYCIVTSGIFPSRN